MNLGERAFGDMQSRDSMNVNYHTARNSVISISIVFALVLYTTAPAHQYFVNHNFSKGWYVTSSPIIAGNWRAADGYKWLVPFGAGFGRVTRIGAAPENWQAAAYANVIRPDTLPSPRWQLRLQLALLYPQKR
jgi:hypothetical protein